MTTGPDGIRLIKSFEGLALSAYLDVAGIPTVGYGHTHRVDCNQCITQEQADTFLEQDLKFTESAVNNLVTVPITQQQFDALVSFTFNVGVAALAHSTLLALLNSSRPPELIAVEFLKWSHAGLLELPGLKRRRTAESQLFLGVTA